MDKKPVINIRGMDCSPEFEEEFNKWYSEKHIPMLLETGEIRRVTRYKRSGDDKDYPRYLAVYEFENQEAFDRYNASPKLAVAAEDARQTFKEGEVERRWRVQYEAMGTWEG